TSDSVQLLGADCAGRTAEKTSEQKFCHWFKPNKQKTRLSYQPVQKVASTHIDSQIQVLTAARGWTPHVKHTEPSCAECSILPIIKKPSTVNSQPGHVRILFDMMQPIHTWWLPQIKVQQDFRIPQMKLRQNMTTG